MNIDMTCRGMKFEVGKTYHVGGEIIPCRNGLHFCARLIDVFPYYKREGHRFFEVEACGIIEIGANKCVASDLKIVRELSNVEINRAVYGNGTGNGCDYGTGNGYGCGYGYVDGNGHGCGDGHGYGWGNGCGNGDGNGYGCGCDYGTGNGYGLGDSIHKILLFT